MTFAFPRPPRVRCTPSDTGIVNDGLPAGLRRAIRARPSNPFKRRPRLQQLGERRSKHLDQVVMFVPAFS